MAVDAISPESDNFIAHIGVQFTVISGSFDWNTSWENTL